MKIARIQLDGQVSYAQVQGDSYRLIAGDIFGEHMVSDIVVPASQARLLAPVDPPQLVAIGLNYRKHAEETGAAVPTAPVVFLKGRNTVTAAGAPILLPEMAPAEVDYEAELVIVIGKTAKHIAEADVDQYILGYTCGNDVSARDCQHRYDKQWARGKGFDTFAPMGPHIVTDIDPQNLRIRAILNGQVMQDSNTADMIFSCRYLVSYVSRCMTLYPGSVIMTGTPSGVGASRKPQVFLRAGDEVTVDIENVGSLTNPVQLERP